VAAVYGPVSFSQQVAPIFEARCAECHGPETMEVELSLVTYDDVMKGSQYGTVIEAGDPDTSLLFEMIVAGEMPQDADPLSEEEIEILRTWIAEGARNN
jgi:mono/diheme cytochrome c family protein